MKFHSNLLSEIILGIYATLQCYNAVLHSYTNIL